MIFRCKISRWEAKRELRDRAMRRSLLELLQDATKDEHNQPWPDIEPMMDDEQVLGELKRILGG